MIYEIFSSLETFKDYGFHSGLNIILSDKLENSGAGQTRNKAGKSSLVLLIHFLLGKEGDPSSLFRKTELKDHYFGMVFQLRGAILCVRRRGAEFSNIEVELVGGSFKEWPINPLELGSSVHHAKWTEILGRAMFLIPETAGKFNPKFAMLFNYFARRSSSGAFLKPQEQSSRQLPYDVRIALSYIIGLDWHINAEREELRQEAENTKKLQKAAKEGLLEGILGDPKQLLTQAALAQEEVNRLSEAVRSFKMLPDYVEREREANSLTRQLNNLADANAQDSLYIHDLEQSLVAESIPQLDDVKRLYDEAGIALPGVALQRFDEVRKFHESIVRNRKLYLEEELTRARNSISARLKSMREVDERRAELMSMLKTHGALQHYSRLQSELNLAETRAELIKKQRHLLSEVTERVAQYKIEQQQIFLRLQRDFEENSAVLTEAILAFEEASRALYENAGNLAIFATETGPQFEVTIQGQKSQGVSNAQIFCFDMMLMTMAHRRNISPGFLVHDSHLFDPIDERQKEKALEYGAQLAERLGFQYIVTLNTDQIPTDRVTSFVIEDYVINPRLTDNPGGGLFGFEFD
jgi:uncharacterized protein YydD (DUF2326 family)